MVREEFVTMCEGKRVNTGVVLGVCIICLSKGTPPPRFLVSIAVRRVQGMGENRFWVRNEVAHTNSLVTWRIVDKTWDQRPKTVV